MTNIQFQTQGTPITESDVLDFERKFTIALPKDYRDFLLEKNGGEQPKPEIFKWDSGDAFSLKTFSSLKGKSHMSLENALTHMKCILPEGAIPIGSDSFGNGICLYVSGKKSGEVWFWDHEQEHDGLEGQPEQLTFIAHSFQKFLGSLFAKPARI